MLNLKKVLILYCNCNLQVAYGIANHHISIIIVKKKIKNYICFLLACTCACFGNIYKTVHSLRVHMYAVVHCMHSHEEWISVFTFMLCVALCTHTGLKYWYEAETLVSFHSDTWFPWETCDVTWEQRGTWTQPTVYLQHMPLLIKDN